MKSRVLIGIVIIGCLVAFLLIVFNGGDSVSDNIALSGDGINMNIEGGEVDVQEGVGMDNVVSENSWQVYENQELQFSLQYPETFTVEVEVGADISVSSENTSHLAGRVQFRDPNDPYSSFTITAYRDPLSNVLQARMPLLFKDPEEGGSVPEPMETQINGLTLIYFETLSLGKVYPGQYFVGNESVVYEVQHTTGDQNFLTYQNMLLSLSYQD